MTPPATDAQWHGLNDGTTLPPLGLGTAPLPDEAARPLVASGLAAGYRLIDTGAIYGNERGVGAGLADSGVAREQIRLLTKLRGRDQGRASTYDAARASLANLAVDYLDLYLIHWPMPDRDQYVPSWEAMIQLREQGLVRSIGVSNFLPEHLQRLVDETGVAPSVNQIELHPGFPQDDIRQADADLGIRTLGYSPLGHGTDLLEHHVVVEIAARHDVTPAQVALRWQVQLGAVPLPRTADPDRQRANLDLFGFALTADEMTALSNLPGGRIGWDPRTREEL